VVVDDSRDLTTVAIARGAFAPEIAASVDAAVTVFGSPLLLVLARLPDLDKATYSRFLAENEPFVNLTNARILSYWSCYYRGRYPLHEDPNRLALQALLPGARTGYASITQGRLPNRPS
jgi:hypothetical protein